MEDASTAPPDNPPPSTNNSNREDATAILKAWQISPATHASILHTQILPAELHPYLHNAKDSPGSTSTTTRPLAVLVLGQTGAGKTRLAPLLLSAFASSSPPAQRGSPAALHLIADTFKTYHPFYRACFASHPHLASRLASDDAARWLHDVCVHATSHQIPNILLETASRRRRRLPQQQLEQPGPGGEPAAGAAGTDFPQLVDTFHSAGYLVRVAVLAVPSALSRLGVLVRYHKRLPEAGSRGLPVRLTPRGVHDDSFEGVAEAVKWIDRDGKGKVERVVVVRRNGGVVYADERREAGGGWKSGEAKALRALEVERVRALSAGERRMAEEDMEMLRGLQDPKVDAEVEEIERLIAGLGPTGTWPPQDTAPFQAEDFVSRDAS